jgi:hypothetical protein
MIEIGRVAAGLRNEEALVTKSFESLFVNVVTR